MARHKSPGLRRSGTPCVLRLAFYLGTVLSAVLRIPGLRGGEFTPGTGATFCGGCSNQRYYGMRCNPPSRPSDGLHFGVIQLKRVCFAQPQRAILSKMGAAAAGQLCNFVCINASRRQAGRSYQGQQKPHSREPECGIISCFPIDKSSSNPYTMGCKDGFSDGGSEVPVRFSSNEG